MAIERKRKIWNIVSCEVRYTKGSAVCARATSSMTSHKQLLIKSLAREVEYFAVMAWCTGLLSVKMLLLKWTQLGLQRMSKLENSRRVCCRRKFEIGWKWISERKLGQKARRKQFYTTDLFMHLTRSTSKLSPRLVQRREEKINGKLSGNFSVFNVSEL